jgi:glycerol-3-phosphate dehydrogenase (NAD(P)+)
LLGLNGFAVRAFEFDAEVVADVNAKACNSKYLPGIKFVSPVTASTDLAEVLSYSELVFNCLPSRFSASTLQTALSALPLTAALVNLSKGLNEQGQTVTEQLRLLFPEHQVVMLSGPSLANEFAQKQATAVTLAGADVSLEVQVGAALDNDFFAVNFSDDLLAVEYGGILKNIYALGLGMSVNDRDNNLNFIGAYMCQALAEMKKIISLKGGNASNLDGISGLGDLIATAMSDHSHNVSFGKKISGGATLESLSAEKSVLPEGVNTLAQILKQAQAQQLQLPLAENIQQLLLGSIDSQTFRQHFIRELQQK